MRGVAAGLLALACCMPVAAQQRSDEKTPAQRCLSHEKGPAAEPEYPAEAYQANRGGRVQVALVFRASDTRPEMRVLLHEGEHDLLASVREHVAGLRVPCMAAGGAEVELRQEYVFAADTRAVHWSHARDRRTQEDAAVWDCLAHDSGRRAPDYPRWAQRDGVWGRVVLRLSFDAADTPPRVEAFSRDNARRLARDMSAWAQGYRLPCLTRPVSTLYTFVLMFEGESYGFREISFLQLLKNTRGILERPLAFDTRGMGCPFDLRVQALRPQLANNVGEVGESVPARRTLIEWLERFEFELPPASLDAAWGDTFKITVPCINVGIKPKEKT